MSVPRGAGPGSGMFGPAMGWPRCDAAAPPSGSGSLDRPMPPPRAGAGRAAPPRPSQPSPAPRRLRYMTEEGAPEAPRSAAGAHPPGLPRCLRAGSGMIGCTPSRPRSRRLRRTADPPDVSSLVTENLLPQVAGGPPPGSRRRAEGVAGQPLRRMARETAAPATRHRPPRGGRAFRMDEGLRSLELPRKAKCHIPEGRMAVF
jgi:hypothetical protein